MSQSVQSSMPLDPTGHGGAEMRIGLSILLIAVGAILRFALETSVDGIDLDVAGLILMIVGGIGLVVSLLMSRRPSRRDAPVAAQSGEAREITTTTERTVL